MKRLLVISLITAFWGAITAQEHSPRIQDAELWTSLKASKKLSKKVDLALSTAYRLENNATEYKSSFIQFDAAYNLTKKWNVSSAYRYTDRGNSNYEHIWMLKSRYKYRLKPFDLSARFRYDFRVNEDADTRQIIRQKVQAKYKRKKHFYRPFVFYEFFYTKTNVFSNYNRYRLGLGSSFKINKKMAVELSYFLQSDQNQPRPEDSYVFDLGFSYEL